MLALLALVLLGFKTVDNPDFSEGCFGGFCSPELVLLATGLGWYFGFVFVCVSAVVGIRVEDELEEGRGLIILIWVKGSLLCSVCWCIGFYFLGFILVRL